MHDPDFDGIPSRQRSPPTVQLTPTIFPKIGRLETREGGRPQSFGPSDCAAWHVSYQRASRAGVSRAGVSRSALFPRVTRNGSVTASGQPPTGRTAAAAAARPKGLGPCAGSRQGAGSGGRAQSLPQARGSRLRRRSNSHPGASETPARPRLGRRGRAAADVNREAGEAVPGVATGFL